MTTPYDEVLDMLQDLEKRESKLTEWEQGFVQSCDEQLAAGRALSSKQCQKVEEIWERVT